MSDATHPLPAAGTATAATQSRITAAFAKAKAQGRTALVPFYTAGYPTMPESEAIMVALVEGGADVLEVGVPFSDPIAEGPTIQHSSHESLRNGTRLVDVLALVRRLREQHGVEVPIVLMGYFNPIYHHGVSTFARDAAAAGADGFIVPDLPIEESEPLRLACEALGLDLVIMVAPTSTDARIAEITAHSAGFVYCVSLTGVTGGRTALPDLGAYIGRVRATTTLPIVVGFGVSTPEHVRQVGEVADGAAIGSALIAHLDAVPAAKRPAAAETFMRRLAEGAGRGTGS